MILKNNHFSYWPNNVLYLAYHPVGALPVKHISFLMIDYIKRTLLKFNKYRLQRLSNRNFLIIAALIVGILAGLTAAVLKLVTHHIESFLQYDFTWQYKYYIYLFFPFTGILLSIIYVKRFIRKDVFETGLTPILYAVSKRGSRINFHNIYSQVITSALTVGFGGSTGLEAPVVFSGSAIGSNTSKIFGLSYRETTMLLACGAAAAIAAAFNSPIAGIVFAIEILLPEFSIPAFIPLLIAAAAASVVGRFFNYQQLFFLTTEGWEIKAILFYAVLAAFIGVFSIFVTKLTYFIKGSFKKIKNVYTRVLVGGLILGLLIFIFPTLYGEGYVTVSRLLAGDYQSIVKNSIFADYSSVPLWIIIFSILTIFAKSAATLVTLGAGGNGGVFGPSLIMGGLFGFVFSFAINQTGLVHLNVSNFIVAGMAAALSGIMHAPLTGIFLIAEITGGYVLMVPLMIVSSISYFISKVNQKHSIYTKILAEKGELLSHEDKDSTVLRMLKLKYLIETNFIKFNVDENPLGRSNEIIRSNRNVFPVIDNENKLAGIVYSEHLFEVIVDKSEGVRISDLMQPVPDFIHINENMVQVMNKMEKDDIWLLPVVNNDSEYLGFVSKTAIFNKYRALLIRQKSYLQ